MSFFQELKQRNVVKVAVLYAVASWLILQVGDVLFDNLGAPDWAFRIVLALLILFFVPALVFAWMYELTPEGLKRENDVDRSQHVTSRTGHKVNLLIVVLLIAAIATVLLDRLVPPPAQQPAVAARSEAEPPPAVTSQPASRPADPAVASTAAAAGVAGPPARSIAVLPFANMSGDQENEYFADGLSEEILNFLAGVPDLRVTARTSSFQFKGQNLDVREIGNSLNVAHVLEGSVRRSQDRARITAQLIRASDGYHLWSETYDRQLDDIFEVQTEIAENVTQALGVVLDDTQRQAMLDAGLRNVEAFIAFQRGRHAYVEAHVQGIDMDLLAGAADDFTRALQLEPGFADAYFMRSDYHAHRLWLPDLSDPERDAAFADYSRDQQLAIEHARSGAQRALVEVDRELMRPNWSALPVRMAAALDATDCETAMWLEVSPLFGLAARQLEHDERMIECDPLNSLHYYGAMRAALWAGRLDAAAKWAEIGLRRLPDDPSIAVMAVLVSIAQDRPDEARERARGLRGWAEELARFNVAIASGDVALARSLVPVVIAAIGPGLQLHFELTLNAMVGDRAAANAVAARMDAMPGGSLMLASATVECLCGAPFDLEATPRFRERLEEAGVSWPPAAILTPAPAAFNPGS